MTLDAATQKKSFFTFYMEVICQLMFTVESWLTMWWGDVGQVTWCLQLLWEGDDFDGG